VEKKNVAQPVAAEQPSIAEQPIAQPQAVSASAALEQQIFVQVIAALAGKGVPPAEAAALAAEYASAGVSQLR
jgi:hypothetical protein